MSTVTKPIALDETLEGVKNAILSLPGGGHVTTVAENLADAYDSTASYAVGDFCIYENVLYKCNTAIASGESWTAAHWTAITVDDAINNVESDIASIHATGTTNATGATITVGTYFYLNGVLVQAIADIASEATFTSGTNYETVTAGALNELKSALDDQIDSVMMELTDPTARSANKGSVVYYNGDSYLVTRYIAAGETASSFSSKLRAYPDGALNGLFYRVKFKRYDATASGVTIVLNNSYRGLFFVCDSTLNQNGLYMLATQANGTVVLRTISEAANTTITTTTAGQITITATSGSRQILLISLDNFPSDQ